MATKTTFMKTASPLLITALSLLTLQNALAQSPFNTFSLVDTNNISASVMPHGDLWWNPVSQAAACEFPKGTGVSLGVRAGVWLSGNDAGNTLHLSAVTYKETVGVDYWPGPYSINQDHVNSQNWNRIWKIDRTDINTFLAITNHTTGNTPIDILQWPAKGNPNAVGYNNAALTITTDMAPFVDVNNDGIYNALQGDYPLMKGDQMLWWVFTDNGPTHNTTTSPALGVETHATAYAYRRGTLIDNVIYYEYDIINQSSNTYSNFRFGQFADMDLGNPFDDFVGYDSTWRMGFIYNGQDTDGYGMPNYPSYDAHPPVAAITMVQLPEDNGNSYVPAGSFLPYYNDNSNIGNPTTGQEYDNYMRLKYRDGSSAAASRYMTEPLFECDSSHNAYDRRFVLTTGDMSFAPGATKTIVAALITTDTGQNNTCHNITMNGIRTVADTAWHLYHTLSVPQQVAMSATVSIYPSPFSNTFTIQSSVAGKYMVYNTLGQKVSTGAIEAGKNEINNMRPLAAGSYFIQIYNEQGYNLKTQQVIKQ